MKKKKNNDKKMAISTKIEAAKFGETEKALTILEEIIVPSLEELKKLHKNF